VEFRKPEFSKHQLDSSISAVVVSLPYLDYDLGEVSAISAHARSMGIAFFAVIDSVNICWMFSDFGPSHVVDAHTPPLKRDDRTGDRAALTNRVEEFEFCDFSTYLTAPINDKYLINKPSFPSEVFIFVHFFLHYQSARRRIVEKDDPSPKRARRDVDFDVFLREALAEASSQTPRVARYLGTQTPAEFANHLIREYHSRLALPALPHLAAIHGALVTQEVIKYVTNKDPPLVNSIVIHNEECSAIVVKQPPHLSSRIITSGDQDDGNDVEIVSGKDGVASVLD